MTIIHRSYNDSEREFLQVRSLFMELYAVQHRPLTWLFSRLDNWRYVKVTDRQYPEFFSDACHVWLDNNVVVGTFISENNKEDINVFTRPGNEALLPEILSWVESEWAFGKSCLETEVFEYDQVYRKVLHDHDFINLDESLETREYNLDNRPVSAPLPLGYKIKSVAEVGTLQDKVHAISEIFEHARDRITVDVYKNWFNAPSYHPELDLIVYTSDGTPISICAGFIDETNQIAEIETIGTITAYQRLGLAKAAISECFHRLREFDIRKAYISSYSDAGHRVYQSLRPSKVYKKLKYRYFPSKTNST